MYVCIYLPQEPEAAVAGLEEELAASKLREAEANLALKDLRAKVGGRG